MLQECLENVRKMTPLIHCITNYVTTGDVANMLLACGAKPIMADEPKEAAEITACAAGLAMNLGTPGERTIAAMHIAGRRANELGHPVLFDPVGVGASVFRQESAKELLSALHFDVIRGNVTEIKMIYKLYHALFDRHIGEEKAFGTDAVIGKASGVDALASDAVTEGKLSDAVAFVKTAASELHSIVAVTGAVDLISDGMLCYVIRGGREEMSRVTGTGCQLSGLMTAFASANPGNMLTAALAASCTMKTAGEIAWRNLTEEEGNASYRNRMIDAVYRMDGDTLERMADYEVR